MKRLFFSPLYLHIFYLTILLIVSYLLLFIYPSPRDYYQIESSSKCFENASQIAHSRAMIIKSSIDELAKGYQNVSNSFGQETANIALIKSDSIIQKIKNVQKELKDNFKQDSGFFYNKQSVFSTRKVLTVSRINEIKNSFMAFEDSNFVNRFEKGTWQQLQPQISNYRNQILWENINKMSFISANAQLEAMKLAATQTNILILKYLEIRMKGYELNFDKFGLCFSIANPNVKVGEPMLTEISLFNYSSKLSEMYTITCNGDSLEIKDGFAHYEKIFQKAGKQTILTTGIFKNPLHGQTETAKREYTFDILPK